MNKSLPEMTIEAIRSVPFFALLDNESAVALRGLLKIRELPEGSHLFSAGDAGGEMYLIEEGRVRISVKDEHMKEITLAELARGDFFGEMAIVDERPRSADAVVIEAARLAILSREDFMSFIHNKPVVAMEMLRAVFERLRRTDELLQKRVSRNANEEERKLMSTTDRIADMMAEFGGSWKFIITFLGMMIFWIVLNSFILVSGFDPSPYQMLNLVLAVVASLQAPIIMMSQNRQSEKDRLRADLDYKVNLKNELSLTEVLRRLDVIESERLPKLSEEHLALLQTRPDHNSNV